jgi:hypothetical protein
MRAIKDRKNLLAWVLAGLLLVIILLSVDIHTDDVVGVLQGLLIFGLLGLAVLLRWTIILRFWLALIAWLRSLR